MPIKEYPEIWEAEKVLFEKMKKYLEIESDDDVPPGEEPPPNVKYFDYFNLLDYGFYASSNWTETPDGTTPSYLAKAFASENYANIGQSTIRRDRVDELLCKNRTFILESYTRGDFYDLEIERLARINDTEVPFKIATYDQALTAFGAVIPNTI